MIKHKINRDHCMTYEEKISIKKETYDRVCRCLQVDALEDMSDAELEAWGYKRDASELIYVVDFADGCAITWKLCSGTYNYYDDVAFWFKDKSRVSLDCTYSFDDLEVEANNDVYRVKLVIE